LSATGGHTEGVTSAPESPRLPPGERLRRAGIAAWSIIGIVILAAMTAWVLFKIRIIFPPLVLALLIIYLLNPPITRLVNRGVPRPLAAIVMFLTAIAVIVLFAAAVYPFVSRQVSEFADDWPAFRSQIVEFVEDTSRSVEDRLGFDIDTSAVPCLLGEVDRAEGVSCDRVTEEIREQVSGQADRITEIGLGLLGGAVIFILAPLLALYLLIDLPHLQRDMVNLFPEAHRVEAADLGSKIGRAVGGFFRGQLLVAFTVGVLSALGFKIVGLPFWLVIGAIAGFFNLVPLIGPFIGGAIGFLIGTVYGGIGLGLRAALVELVVQQLDNHLISPMVMRRAVQLHPATVVLALLIGGNLAGFWGVLLGVPAVAVAKILLQHIWTTRVLGTSPAPYAPGRAVGEAPSVVPAEVDDGLEPSSADAGGPDGAGEPASIERGPGDDDAASDGRPADRTEERT
jgi:predicted PurR-regulated permease PerM